jgi:D-sedoheptulose 7-phosphate isomerase
MRKKMNPQDNYLKTYFEEFTTAISGLDQKLISEAVDVLSQIELSKGRLFIFGLGGSAANATHAVNDFRKICNIEAYSPTDNIAEFSARINDDGLDSAMENWLGVSRISDQDVCLFFSVGGGDEEKNVSVALIQANRKARSVGAKTISFTGKDAGFLQSNSDICISCGLESDFLTPHAESFQALIWHSIVFHPKLQRNNGKWESLINQPRSDVK